ncbi:MAG TPA: alpha/beta hydrolase, partial [Mycobacterium sp.]|nr:alpha/beta hydrolase [Mycobacterium sp.]
VLRRRKWWPPSKRVRHVLKTVIVAASATACVLMVIPAAAWQRQVSAVMGMEGPNTLGYMRTLIIAVLVGSVCVGAARVLLDLIKTMARFFIRRWHLHDETALFIGSAIVVVLAITLINGVLIRGFLAGANRVFQPQNTTTRAGIVQPRQPERSGSPASYAPWETLGFQGRNFVATGPHADELTRLNGRPAKEPIRVYVGLNTADTDDSRMAVMLSELERTGAFDRKVLVIVPTTGTGWINPVAARSLEMMYNGDTALVGSQYSFLPSWISFLGDREKSMESGRMMINAIHDRWLQLPADHRPKLMLYGESLGSMAGQGAFGWLPDIARMGFSSVLWVGPPDASPLWKAITVRRDPGTPEIEPRYDNGRTVRFSQSTGPADIRRDTDSPWEGTRVLFLQHPSDPIVWWSEDLLLNRPEWLKEPPGRDRTASMRWYPIITFWQVAADMTNASSVPGGHGHNYGDLVLDGWAAVAPPDGWTPDDTERIRIALEKTESVDGPEY